MLAGCYVDQGKKVEAQTDTQFPRDLGRLAYQPLPFGATLLAFSLLQPCRRIRRVFLSPDTQPLCRVIGAGISPKTHCHTITSAVD